MCILRFTVRLTVKFTLTFSFTFTVTHVYTLTLLARHSFTQPHTRTHVHTHSCSYLNSHTVRLAHKLTLSRTNVPTHTHIPTHSVTQILTHIFISLLIHSYTFTHNARSYLHINSDTLPYSDSRSHLDLHSHWLCSQPFSYTHLHLFIIQTFTHIIQISIWEWVSSEWEC